MKKAFYILTLFLLPFATSAQPSTHFEFYGGLSYPIFSSTNSYQEIERTYKGSINIPIGFRISHRINSIIEIGAGVGIFKQKYDQIDECLTCSQDITTTYSFSVKALEIPIFARWTILENDWSLFLYSGINTSALRGASFIQTDNVNGLVTSENAESQFNGFVLGALGGLGIQYPLLDRLSLGGILFYQHDFIALHKESQLHINKVGLQVHLNYRF